MKSINDLRFGEYIEHLRKLSEKSMRQAALAIGVSPQFYSEVEKGRKSAFTKDRLEKLRNFLGLDDESSIIMYDKAADTHKGMVVPQDFSDYIVERDYAMAALRTAKELDANEKDWQVFVEQLRKRKE